MATPTNTGSKHAVTDEIVYTPALYRELRAAQQANPKAKRCRCANPDCRAITKGGNFAPGHDAKMLKRLAYQVNEKTGEFAQFTVRDARRNLYAAGGSDALMDKLVNMVTRQNGQLSGAAVGKPVRVAVRMTIEVTPEQAEALAAEYGIDTDAASIREFVRDYMNEYAYQSPAAEFWRTVS